MRHRLSSRLLSAFALLSAVGVWPVAASPGSDACIGALAELERREQAALAMPPGARPSQRPRLLEQQRRAALACLDGPPDAPPRAALTAPATPAVPAASPSRRFAPSTPGMPAPEALPPARPPVSVTSCDALGCWASDGTRLQKIGPSLLGPGGLCSGTGSSLRCP